MCGGAYRLDERQRKSLAEFATFLNSFTWYDWRCGLHSSMVHVDSDDNYTWAHTDSQMP
jgi:hypothetical protein